MKLQYQLSIIFAVLILSAGITMILFTSELLNNRLEQNLISREKMAIEVLEKRVGPYLAEGNYVAITDILFDEKWTKKDLLTYIVVYDSSGRLVSHTFLADVPEDLRKPNHDVSDEFHSSKQNVGGQDIIEMGKGIKEGEYLIGSIHLGYKQEYLENMVLAIISTLMVFIIVLVVLTLFLGYFLSMLFVKPINQLVVGMNAVSKGDLDTRVSITTKDELEMLANVFNTMTADMNESHKSIDRHHRELESKIEERTKDLNEKIAEMFDTKRAMQNMMEDAEETNRELINAREKLNANLRELKALDVKKDEFISIAAHELKTPLTAIHGFSQLLENEDVVNNAELRNNYLKVIDKETKRLSNLVTEVLDLSRIDLGVIKFSADNIDLYGIIEQIRGETEIKAKEKNLALVYELEKGLPDIVADREKLIQVIINLVTNAEKYTEKGSVKVKIQRAGDLIQFSVEDTGIGIPKKHFPKMFSRFYQVDASYTRKVGGTGLGLSVCKEFVEGMGGRIWFESIAGKGSTFYFNLPANKRKLKKTKE